MSAVWWFLGGYIVGSGAVLVALAVCWRFKQSKSEVPTRNYQPATHPYPLDHEMRRAMVLRHLATGVLSIEDAKQFLVDGTISVNDYRSARDDLHALRNPVPMPSPRQSPHLTERQETILRMHKAGSTDEEILRYLASRRDPAAVAWRDENDSLLG